MSPEAETIKKVVGEWKLCGHLFLALEKCGVSAGWLLRQFEDPNLFELYDEGRKAHQQLFPVPLDCATDMEVALLFYFWPSKNPTIAGGIQAVSGAWKTTRELTLKSWLRRVKLDADGPISKAVDELREGRRYVIQDTQEALWLVDPGLAARVHIALFGAPPPRVQAIAQNVGPPVVPKSISDGSLLKGIQ